MYQGELHFCAVKGALGSLIPHNLHARFDKAASMQKVRSNVVAQGGSYIRLDGWRVSVYEEESLARGRLGPGVSEFLLKLLSRCSSELSLPVSIGSKTVGKLIRSSTSVDSFRNTLRGWTQCWNFDEVKKRSVLLLPIPAIVAEEARDWVLAEVCPSDGLGSLGQAQQLRVTVYDRMERTNLGTHIGGFVQALFGKHAASNSPLICHKELPECLVSTQRLGCVLGMIATLVQGHSKIVPLDCCSSTFVPDAFAAFRGLFAKLRYEVASRSLNDLRDYVLGDVARDLLSMFSEVPRARIAEQAGL